MNKQQIEQNIKNMKAELARMEEELNKPEKFEFSYEKRREVYLLTACRVCTTVLREKDYLTNYRYRILENNANAELLRNKQGNFIGALFEQIDVDYAKNIDWDNTNQLKYHLSYSTDTIKWVIESREYSKLPGVVYTPKLEVVLKAVELLNSGQVEFPTS